MIEWKEYTLGELLAEKPEYGANAAGINYDNKLPRFLRITDISESGKLIPVDAVSVEKKYLVKYQLGENDIVIARTGNTVGKAYLYSEKDGELVFAGYLIRFRFDSQKVDSKLIFQHLLSPNYKAWISNTLRTGAQPNINANEYCNLKLLLPPLPIQQKIARILSTIDGQIEKTEAIIAKYQAIKQGMLQDLFTRGIDVRTGQLRPRYEDAPELYKESALGMIPTEWEGTTIGKSCLIQNQFRKPIAAEIRETMQGKYPYYGPTGIQDYIDEFRVEGKYVLIGEDGDHFLKWSKQEMTILTDGKFNVNNHAHILEGTEGCLTEWIHIFFSHEDITFYLTRQGAGRYKLNKATLKVIEFPLPRVDEQKVIIERLMSINNQIKLDKKNLSKIQLLKQGLMQDLLSGTVAVTA